MGASVTLLAATVAAVGLDGATGLVGKSGKVCLVESFDVLDFLSNPSKLGRPELLEIVGFLAGFESKLPRLGNELLGG